MRKSFATEKEMLWKTIGTLKKVVFSIHWKKVDKEKNFKFKKWTYIENSLKFSKIKFKISIFLFYKEQFFYVPCRYTFFRPPNNDHCL
jgi:ABC-type maltose transport system permease subunit